MLALQAMVFVAAACLVQVHGYGSGAPTDACDDMVPQHHTPPQNSPVPYKIRSGRGREAGTAIISIKGPGPFKGFLAQCRVGDQPVGKFINLPSTAKAVDCGSGKATAVTHSSSADKDSVTLQWQAPPGLKEQVTCYATVAKNGKEFWVKVPTNPLTF